LALKNRLSRIHYQEYKNRKAESTQGTLGHYQNNSAIKGTTNKKPWLMVIPSNSLNLWED